MSQWKDSMMKKRKATHRCKWGGKGDQNAQHLFVMTSGGDRYEYWLGVNSSGSHWQPVLMRVVCNR